MQLDVPVVRSGRVIDRLRRLGSPDCPLFICALESGLVAAVPKLSVVHIDFLASDREEQAASPAVEGKSAFATVRFDARSVLEADEADIRWRIHRAGLLALLSIADLTAPGHPACGHLRSLHASCPTGSFPVFPAPTEEQWELFHDYALYSKARKAGLLTVELSGPPGTGPEQDFQPVFDRMTAALAAAKLGRWQGDSGNDIEFRSKDLAAAQACIEAVLGKGFHGSFRFSVLPD